MSRIPSDEIRFWFGNFEANGKNEPKLWHSYHDLIRAYEPHLIGRAEMRGAAADGEAGLLACEKAMTPPGKPWLRPRGWLGGPAVADLRTALFLRTDVFEPVKRGRQDMPALALWGIPPTQLTVRLARYPGDPNCTREIVVGIAHHAYASPTARQREAEDLTTLADQRDPRDTTEEYPTGRPREAIVAYDGNSYPDGQVAGDVPLPDLAAISDRRHQVHRTVDVDGRYVPDTASDRTLRRAGFEDIARHVAVKTGRTDVLAPTMAGWPDQGGEVRIDRAYATAGVLEAVEDIEVIDTTGLSDHHALLWKISRRKLAQILTPA